MNKMLAVIKREYLQAVRKKMFIVMTFLFPLLMVGAMTVPGLMMSRTLTGRRIAVVDGTGQLRDAFTRANEGEKPDAANVSILKQIRSDLGASS